VIPFHYCGTPQAEPREHVGFQRYLSTETKTVIDEEFITATIAGLWPEYHNNQADIDEYDTWFWKLFDFLATEVTDCYLAFEYFSTRLVQQRDDVLKTENVSVITRETVRFSYDINIEFCARKLDELPHVRCVS